VLGDTRAWLTAVRDAMEKALRAAANMVEVFDWSCYSVRGLGCCFLWRLRYTSNIQTQRKDSLTILVANLFLKSIL
jgi:hypothetical protein